MKLAATLFIGICLFWTAIYYMGERQCRQKPIALKADTVKSNTSWIYDDGGRNSFGAFTKDGRFIRGDIDTIPFKSIPYYFEPVDSGEITLIQQTLFLFTEKKGRMYYQKKINKIYHKDTTIAQWWDVFLAGQDGKTIGYKKHDSAWVIIDSIGCLKALMMQAEQWSKILEDNDVKLIPKK